MQTSTLTKPLIRQLYPSDIPNAMNLSREAGWNQLPADWRRLLLLEPEGCFAIECDARLAATTTVVCYERDLAWVGMVLTASVFRRRGFAERLVRRALEFSEQRGISTVKLDATDSGCPLYRKLGFVEECAVERWVGSAGLLNAEGVEPYSTDAVYDRKVFGAGRSELLAHLAPLGSASLPGCGYAMGRTGALASYFGPCVARSTDAARTLLRWFLARNPQQKIFWDLFPDNTEAVRLATEFGFAPVRHLVRMVRANGSVLPSSSPTDIFAIAGFEFG